MNKCISIVLISAEIIVGRTGKKLFHLSNLVGSDSRILVEMMKLLPAASRPRPRSPAGW